MCWLLPPSLFPHYEATLLSNTIAWIGTAYSSWQYRASGARALLPTFLPSPPPPCLPLFFIASQEHRSVTSTIATDAMISHTSTSDMEEAASRPLPPPPVQRGKSRMELQSQPLPEKARGLFARQTGAAKSGQGSKEGGKGGGRTRTDKLTERLQDGR